MTSRLTVRENKERNRVEVFITEDSGRKNHIGDYTVGNNTLTCFKERSKHYFNKYKGWGIDREIVKYYSKLGADIVVVDTENGIRYETTAIKMLLHGTENQFRGHLPQIFLSEFDFDVRVEVKP